MNLDLLNRIYTDANSGAAFSHWKKLLSKAREVKRDISKEEVISFLASKPAHTIYARSISRHRKRAIKSNYPGYYISIDLLQLSQESVKYNKPYKFILCSNDIFSRLLHLIPLQSKSIKDVIEGFKSLFSKMENVPEKILSDLEPAFYSKIVQDFLKSKNIKLYSQQGAANLKTKNGIVERCQRVIRQLIAKICVEFNTKNFIKNISYIENIYNSRKNRSTGYSPRELHFNRTAIATFQQQLLKQDLLPDKTKTNFQIGDTVRYKLAHNTFSKETKKIFSHSIHTVIKVISSNPTTFLISPPPLHKRLLYAQDLIKVLVERGEDKNFEEIPIDSIVGAKQLPNGEILYSCSLIGHKKHLWLTETQLKKRYILFPQSLDKIKEENQFKNVTSNLSETQPMLTRSQKKIESNKIVTRSHEKISQ